MTKFLVVVAMTMLWRDLNVCTRLDFIIVDVEIKYCSKSATGNKQLYKLYKNNEGKVQEIENLIVSIGSIVIR